MKILIFTCIKYLITIIKLCLKLIIMFHVIFGFPWLQPRNSCRHVNKIEWLFFSAKISFEFWVLNLRELCYFFHFILTTTLLVCSHFLILFNTQILNNDDVDNQKGSSERKRKKNWNVNRFNWSMKTLKCRFFLLFFTFSVSLCKKTNFSHLQHFSLFPFLLLLHHNFPFFCWCIKRFVYLMDFSLWFIQDFSLLSERNEAL